MTRLLLRLFPSAWRARYGEELVDLISDTGMTTHVAADVLHAALAERARLTREALTGGISMTFGPAWRHPTAWAIAGAIVLLPLLFVLSLSIPTDYQLARLGLDGLASSLHSWLNTTRWVDLLLVSLPAVAVLCAAVPMLRVGISHIEGGSEVAVSVRLRLVNILVVLMGLAVGGLLVGHIVFESVLQVGA